MNPELSRLLVDEHLDRLRDAAQAPPGRLALLVRSLFRREKEHAVPVAWLARRTEARDLERLAA